eukprot:Skav231743  [mRNA]  locus=scaffold1584:101592:107589:+ [translate_table: standard]
MFALNFGPWVTFGIATWHRLAPVLSSFDGSLLLDGGASVRDMAGGYTSAMAIEAPEDGFVTSFGTGTKRIRSKYTVNPGYTPVADCFCVRFSPDDQYLATSFANGAIHVYSTDTGRQEYLLNGSPASLELSKTPLPTTQLRWRPHAAASKTQSVLISVNAEFDGHFRSALIGESQWLEPVVLSCCKMVR